MIRALVASPAGFLIGLALGSLGGGGSVLAVPCLIYLAGQTPRQATATSLLVVAISAVVGIVPHWRARRVRLGTGLGFGLLGAGGALLGSRWNSNVDPNALLLAFSSLMLLAAAGMWHQLRSSSGRTDNQVDNADLSEPIARATRPSVRNPTQALKVGIAGTLVGMLTGFLGVGGGFVIVPVLVVVLRLELPEAAGTSLIAITINSAVALLTRLHTGLLEWSTVVPFTTASVIGVVVGGRLVGIHDPATLQRWFIALIVSVALYTAARSLTVL